MALLGQERDPRVAAPSITTDPRSQTRLRFTSTGDFAFVCLLHGHTGVIHVAAAGTPYPHTQQFYNSQAQQFQSQKLAQGQQIQTDARQQAQTGHLLVIAGAGVTPVDLMRFVPQQFQIHAGQSGTWRNIAEGTPHTVTFGPEPSDSSVLVGTDRQGHATLNGHGQAVNSGFIGAPFPAGTDFTVTFTQPGTYRYRCALHDEIGMVGTIVVQP